jgi:cation diffusion facilitator CzcD-associated flavoprotein CzcO
VKTAREHHRVAIIGAGIAGVGLGVRLLQAGIEDFVILERNESVGGTWFEHTYPGCGCDIPTHLYSYSFARNPNWTRMFPRQHEILAYVRRIADVYGVTPRIRFETEMLHSEWDEREDVWCAHRPGRSRAICSSARSGPRPSPTSPTSPD